jgi:cystathionine gamma-synthase
MMYAMTPELDEPLLTAPRWRAEELGRPLPDSPHANSVCLPEWQDVVDYEEKSPRVIERLQAGYPRFVVPTPCLTFFAACRERWALPGEACHAYAGERAATRCADRIHAWSGATARVVPWPEKNVFVVCFPESATTWALKYWRHTGEGISSRRALALLNGTPEPDGTAARQRVIARLANLAGAPEEDVFLFKSGMTAIHALHRVFQRLHPEGTSVQFGFPYVDTLKIQQDFGFRSTFFPLGSETDLRMLNRIAVVDRVAGLFCEFPSNPLLHSPDLAALGRIARNQRFPVVIDDTIATWANAHLLPHADALVTSLTKYFTGRGDLMGGCIVLNPVSPWHDALRAALRAECEETLWGENLLLLDRYSADFVPRMRRINRTAEQLCDWLATHPDVQTVYYPKTRTRALYDACRRSDGGYGGLFSILLRDPARATPAFYRHLEISKGPNLGTVFSLCCPFTLLAHYDELDWAERCGVSRHLLRVSVGLEEPDDLIGRFTRAFAALHPA